MARDESKEKRAAKAAPVPVAPSVKGKVPVAAEPAVEEVREKKKEKIPQKERPRSKKKHTKVQIWKLYSVKDNQLSRKKENCPRCGPGTFMAAFRNRRYCGKCGFGVIEKEIKAVS